VIAVNGSHDDYFVQCGKAGTPVKDCLVIDAHGHLGQFHGFSCPDSSVETLIRCMDKMGIDRIYVSSMPAIQGLHREGNDQVLEAVGRYPDRICGYMAVSVGYPEMVLAELERCHKAGLRVVKIFNYAHVKGVPYDHPNYEIVYDFASEHRLSILAHTWGDSVTELESAFKKYPGINWLLAHTGCAALDLYVRAAKEHENVYLETCFSAAPRGMIETLVSRVPLHKIIWGSDQIFINAAHQLGRVLFAQISPAQKKAILGTNAARILG
jgi:predicted TIM-barrel fold metal-dependent hydrolase